MIVRGNIFALFLLCFTLAYSDEVEVKDVKIDCDSACSISVTLLHADTGWDHYANRWEVLSPDEQILATRTLHHPHVEEQPFTRSLSSVSFPNNIDYVLIRGHDNVHGYGELIKVELPNK